MRILIRRLIASVLTNMSKVLQIHDPGLIDLVNSVLNYRTVVTFYIYAISRLHPPFLFLSFLIY